MGANALSIFPREEEEEGEGTAFPSYLKVHTYTHTSKINSRYKCEPIIISGEGRRNREREREEKKLAERKKKVA